MTAYRLPMDEWSDELVALGFDPSHDGRGFRNDRFVVTAAGGRMTVADTRVVASRKPTSGPLGHPGLWRHVAANGSGADLLFELPPQVIRVGGGPEVGRAAAQDVVSWAVSTSDGSSPDDWRAPAPDEVSSWIPRERLTVQAGEHVRQGRLVVESNRVALVFTIVDGLDPALSDARRAWLDALLVDAQRTWSLVRVGFTDDGAARAEIDLTGAPPGLLEPMSRTAVDALRWVVEWLVPVAAFVTDPSQRSSGLEAVSPGVPSARAADPTSGGVS